jgi:hypothetical protein
VTLFFVDSNGIGADHPVAAVVLDKGRVSMAPRQFA